MAQQNSKKPQVQFIVMGLYALLVFGMWKAGLLPGMQKPTAPAAVTQSVQEAQKAEELLRAGKNPGPERVGELLSAQEQKNGLEKLAARYEELYQQDKASLDGKLARFREINLYDFLGHNKRMRDVSSAEHWYDTAIERLKDMEKSFTGTTGTVTLEVNEEPQTKTGDLGKIATERLDTIRSARDLENRKKVTYKVIGALVNMFGGKGNAEWSYFLALLLVVGVLKGITFPFQRKQYQYQRDMMRLQPLIKEAQEQYKNRPPQELNQRTMEIYKENNVNLLSGCLPMIALMVVLLPAYWMVRDYEYQFTFGKFLWIGAASTQHLGWVAHNLAQFDVIMFAVYLASMVFYSFLQPKPADPAQAQQQKMMVVMMPLMFGWFMWSGKWSSAFMLYWLILNLVSMYQSWRLNKEFGPANAVAMAGTTGGALAPAATARIEPMKGVRKPNANGRSNGGRANGSARIRPSTAPGGPSAPKNPERKSDKKPER